ncbi:MAG: exo-alpha-sialidase [Rhodoferax sp.]|uniref:exo-alpha-sialidase n=1 Tax=Rhodoferax sp. TaxID=50421 RepID=UPI0017928E7D|nr:sialidase family protein [Rhodoferax sp.]NMM12317.1 exo-alpha-sialidase [Rhodoferax sp.]NMM20276.1 exo-alpha-sialidase [Rhodoferax sp.]
MPDSLIAAVTRFFGSRLLGGLLICAALIGLDVGRRADVTPLAQAVWPTAEITATGRALVPVGRGYIPMPANTPAAHASSLLAMPAAHPSTLMAFWFAGTRESAPDVQIAAAQFDRATQQWSAARFVVNRLAMGESLGWGVRRLGNPVAWLDRQGKIHLFVVATGLGGWAAARIVHLRQSNAGQDFAALSFDVVRVLPLSWLWNTSFLVRAAPLPLADGGMVLPVHFELGIKYPVALRFDANGEFKSMVRISRRTHLLQPTLLIVSDSHWLALMRDQSPVGKVAVAQTSDSGQHWVDLPDLALVNTDSSVAGLAVAPGHLFLAHNSSPHARTTLDLSASVDGRTWSLAQGLAHGAGSDEFSYPALAWADDSLWVSYTDQRQRIGWQRFSLSPAKH